MSSNNQTQIKPITAIARDLGIDSHELELYGENKAKINLSIFKRLESRPAGNLILVSAITPTPAGEGKTTTAIALAMGLNRIGKRACVTLREPSLGPLFGIKGGATGAGKARVYPSDDINMHFTGDIHAVTAAHNLIAALVDNHIMRRKEPALDPRQVLWGRVMDMNDRALRRVIIGLGGKGEGVPRETGFTITASSEIMAILCLAQNYLELKERLGRILIGFTFDNKPVYLKDLNICGAPAALLRDALKPNLVQTIEGTPAFVHGGPFANIAQGTCSVLSMKLALKLTPFVVTEAGFGFDLGAEKFFDIVGRAANLKPKAVVLVATIRALKMHGGVKKEELTTTNPTAVEAGLSNLSKHLENIAHFQVPVVVAINRFGSDTKEEIAVVKNFCQQLGVPVAEIDAFNQGGAGAIELAHLVEAAIQTDHQYQPLYPLDWPVEQKIETICRKIYGSKAVEFTPDAQKDLNTIKKLGLEQLPVCIAKTQASLSDNPDLLGRPRNFLITVRKINISTGAGFLVPITGDILLMPGLPVKPIAENVDIDENGNIIGLF
jgi:formate--tetrahydrofolate ligase